MNRPIINEALKAEAQAMLDDYRDYFPSLRNGVPHGATHGLTGNYMLYQYEDGVWLVDTLYSCVMGDAIKLEKVASSVALSSIHSESVA